MTSTACIVPSPLEMAMEHLIDVFGQYSQKDQMKQTLNKQQLRKLMDEQLTTLMQHHNNQKAIDNVFKDLDFDGDGLVAFEEFLSLVAGLTKSCNDRLLIKEHKRLTSQTKQ
ncbi:protein S100-A1 [Callorhinchus milii]|uniref:Protein S100-A1-like n=1 Tax=Callorhinchus milii TaxID=7868 RepID=V9LCN3_CALMI|nr:protein S100-A1 [Callorhinchus milii]XP_007897098.1 protein S100-A1 [Callorhinchus milii]|eukprot:gi/632962053/ref/XP_007897097.1/ PREDICTED: protein S100-A1-like [Callorhinchus milii]